MGLGTSSALLERRGIGVASVSEEAEAEFSIGVGGLINWKVG